MTSFTYTILNDSTKPHIGEQNFPKDCSNSIHLQKKITTQGIKLKQNRKFHHVSTSIWSPSYITRRQVIELSKQGWNHNCMFDSTLPGRKTTDHIFGWGFLSSSWCSGKKKKHKQYKVIFHNWIPILITKVKSK